jgi:hypothetical protein
VTTSRKAAIQAFKERKATRGVFVVRCGATGSVWVESSMDLDAAENRTFFLMRSGDVQMDKSVKNEYATHGREGFTFEILEKLDGDLLPMEIRDQLRARKLHWKSRLNAKTLWPV